MPAPSTSHTRAPGVRRNLFHQHLSRRPTTAAAAAPPPASPAPAPTGIVVRDQNGEFHIDDALRLPPHDHEETCETAATPDEAHQAARDRQQWLREAMTHYYREKNRTLCETTGETTELLENVRASLKAKMNALAEDNWRYEAEDGLVTR
ncbi:hypothetical protein K3495_g186 [Podosphaera aphanis]|nr:hypothetical protein K3495_g186 [Podosphaera aphanis]